MPLILNGSQEVKRVGEISMEEGQELGEEGLLPSKKAKLFLAKKAWVESVTPKNHFLIITRDPGLK